LVEIIKQSNIDYPSALVGMTMQNRSTWTAIKN